MTTYGLQIPWFGFPAADHRSVLAGAAQQAEDAGFTSLWVMDHFFQIPGAGQPTDPMHEAYTTLGYLAGVTEEITLGAMITGVTYRHPGLLVKQVTTLDVLSGGRAWFTIGAAWFEEEHTGLGVPFPPLRERFERVEEALQIALQMWSSDDGPYEGQHYSLERTLCSPEPIADPRPPIMIGGSGERKTLRLVAKYADASNLGMPGPDEVRHKLEVLEAHCNDVGRDPDEIETSVLVLALDPDEGVASAKAYVDAGIDHIVFTAVPVNEPGAVAALGAKAQSALGA